MQLMFHELTLKKGHKAEVRLKQGQDSMYYH